MLHGMYIFRQRHQTSCFFLNHDSKHSQIPLTSVCLPSPHPPLSFLSTERSTSPPCWTYEGWCGRRNARRSSTLSKTSNAAVPWCAATAPCLLTSPSHRRYIASAWASSASPWASLTGFQSTAWEEAAGQIAETRHPSLLRIWRTQTNFTERIRQFLCLWRDAVMWCTCTLTKIWLYPNIITSHIKKLDSRYYSYCTHSLTFWDFSKVNHGPSVWFLVFIHKT